LILLSAELGPFLEFLFSGVARKPKRLKVKQTASVARYLKTVAWEAQPSQEREELERLVDVIWLTMLRFGQINIAEKQEVIHFLNEHAHTYLNSFDVDKIVKFVESRKEPTTQADSFRPPMLVGKERSISSGDTARLQDDLTERIYVAYHVLRRTRTPNARGYIAKVLNKLGLATRARSGTVTEWGANEVIERVKQFQDKMKQQLPPGLSEADRATRIEKQRNKLVDGWISGYRFSLWVRSISQPRTS
jgi:hypothetical protein